MTKTLYITHPEFDFSIVNKDSILLSNSQIDLKESKYHTSLGDLSSSEIIQIAENFDVIDYVSDMFLEGTDIFDETLILLTYLSHRHKVTNFNSTEPNNFIQQKEIYSRPDGPMLWVFGCSHSHGVGLADLNLRYSNIISDRLNLPLKSITEPGSSTRWSLRHMINSKINSADLVIWQLTTPDRISVLSDTVNEVRLSQAKNKCLLEVYTDQQVFFDHLSLLNYGVNYLRSKGVKFVLTSIEADSSLFYNYKKEYVKYKEYCYSPNFNVDHGHDNIHFGPLSHKNLALSLLDHIHYNYGKLI